MARSGKKRRVVFSALVAALWLSVGVLCLEVYAAGRQLWVRKHNPFVLDREQEGDAVRVEPPAERVVADPRLAHEVPWFLPQGVPGARQRPGSRDGTGKAFVECGVPARQETDDAKKARRAVFPLLDDGDRQCFAVLFDETVAVFDGDAVLTQVYGNKTLRMALGLATQRTPGKALRRTVLRKQWQHLMRIVRRTAASGDTQQEDLPLSEEDGGIEFVSCNCLPSNSSDRPEERVFVFLWTDPIESVVTELPEDSPWEILFKKYKKNLRGAHSGMGVAIDTNNYGFRDEDVAVPKPQDLLRILCIGGSTTEEGFTSDSTYPNRLERKLRAHFPTRAIEVVNCGTSGLDTSGHLLRVADYLELEPDLIVAYMGVNDIIHRYLDMDRGQLAPWQHVLRLSRFARLHGNRLLFRLDENARQDVNRHVVQNLAALSRVFRSRGIRIALCSFAYPNTEGLSKEERDYFDYDARTYWKNKCLDLDVYVALMAVYNQELRALCERECMFYVPVAEHVTAGTKYFGDICHMMEPGIEQKAQIVFEYLKDYVRPALDR